MQNPYKVTPIIEGNTIILPFIEPIILKGKREDGNFVFKFTNCNENYYIITTYLQGVINNNLPDHLEDNFKALIIDSVNHYCECSRQGLPDNIFAKYLKKNAINNKTNDLKSSTTHFENG